MEKTEIEEEIDQEIKWRGIYSRFDFILNNALVLIAVIASGFPAYIQIFGGFESKIVAAVAAIPAFILLLQKTFKWEQRADWHWEYKRKVKDIKRQIRDQGISKENASKQLSKLESDLAGSFPGTSSLEKSN